MNGPHIEAVELAEDGLVVIFDDASSAFYHESVFQAHLQPARPAPAATERKPVRRVSHPAKKRAS